MDWPTIVVLSVIALIVLAIVIKLIINKRQGKTSCSCGCGGCAMRDMCHSQKNKRDGANQALPSEQENGVGKPE